MSYRVKHAARGIASYEPAVVVLAAPFLLFPTLRPTLTVGALTALMLVWLLRWLGTGTPGALTPMDLALLLLLLTVPFAVWASAMPDLTLPKLTGLVLGVAAFRALVDACATSRDVGRAAFFFLLLGLGLALMGLVSTNWTEKLPGLEPVLAGIPRVLQTLPGAEAGIHANELGGTLLLFLPVSAAAMSVRGLGRAWVDWAARFAAVLLTLLLAMLLLLSQSRSAWLGSVAGLTVMAGLRWRRVGWLLLAACLVLALAVLILGPTSILQAFFEQGDVAPAAAVVGNISLQGRIEIWNRALYAIQDFPFTGTGLGTFRRLVNVLYPLFLTSPGHDISHAHNIFLQVALDLGLLGLIAYLALVGTALWIGWRVARRSFGKERSSYHRYPWLALGVVGSLVAFHVYGLTDAIALGAKPGVALWMLLGMAAALWRTRRKRVRVSRSSERRQEMPVRA